jgi:hypothetical protein
MLAPMSIVAELLSSLDPTLREEVHHEIYYRCRMLFYVERPMLLRAYMLVRFVFTYAMGAHQRDKLLPLARFT